MARGKWTVVNILEGTAGPDELLGGREVDILKGNEGDDVLDGGPKGDTLTGGAGADTFKVHNWSYSNSTYGMDTVTDFSVADGDMIDLRNVKHYSGPDHLTVGPLTMANIIFEPIPGGNIMHASVWEGDTRWDVDMTIMGDTPTESNFIFK